MAAEEAEAVVALMDSDGDGLFGLEDFVKIVEGAGEEERQSDLIEPRACASTIQFEKGRRKKSKSEMAFAAEEEEAERGDQTHDLEGGDGFEKNLIYKPEVQIEPLLPPQCGGAPQLPPPRTAAAAAGGGASLALALALAPAAAAPLLVQPLEEQRETGRFLHESVPPLI
ncbi:hypothetical protein SASPL_152019 [Salvia splendens]|uniref:EF-hand domain-containing protein n=1 Tax=Salvia splendens TaxID=180675 RepID=A0A8X8W2I5_SALSN|nr:hypothetical protein SASPL_152019 [Salvia splendens]